MQICQCRCLSEGSTAIKMFSISKMSEFDLKPTFLLFWYVKLQSSVKFKLSCFLLFLWPFVFVAAAHSFFENLLRINRSIRALLLVGDLQICCTDKEGHWLWIIMIIRCNYVLLYLGWHCGSFSCSILMSLSLTLKYKSYENYPSRHGKN